MPQIGVILIVTRWVNERLFEELEKYCTCIHMLSFGLSKKDRRQLNTNFKKCFSAHYSSGDYHSRKYAKILLNELRRLREKGTQYYLCLHSDSAVINSLSDLFAVIEANPKVDMIERKKETPQQKIDQFEAYDFGHSLLNEYGNRFLKLMPGKRYRSVGFRFGHDAWGLTSETVDYMLSTSITKYLYGLCRFSRDCRFFFIHTLAFHGLSETSGSSPEKYAASPDYSNYAMAYADHAGALLKVKSSLFFPTSRYAPIFSALINNTDEETAEDIQRSPFNNYPPSRPPILYNWTTPFSSLELSGIPFFSIYVFPGCDVVPLTSCLNSMTDVVCHGSLFHPKIVDYLKPEHICPRYPTAIPSLRNYRRQTFVLDLLFFYHGKLFGFTLPIRKTIYPIDYFWTLKNCQGVFILPDAVFRILKLNITSCNKKRTLEAYLDLMAVDYSAVSHIEDASQLFFSIQEILSITDFRGNIPIIIPESSLKNECSTEQIAQTIIDKLHILSH